MSDAASAPRNAETLSSALRDVSTAGELRPLSRRRLLLYKFLRHHLAVVGLVTITILALGAVFATKITPYDPYKINMRDRLRPPSAEHLLGTDDLGRDELARLMLGGQVSLAVGFLSMLVSLAVGVTVGSLAGYYGGKVDNTLMRLADLMFMFPPVLLAMIFVTMLGQTLVSLAVIIGFVSWMGLARLVRATFLSLKEQEFVVAAHAIGATNTRIIVQHILPNVTSTIIVALTLGIARAILLESALSYLGFGIQVPIPSWGIMLYTAQGQLRTASWLSLSPGLLIFIAVLSINFVGDGLRDALDPRLK